MKITTDQLREIIREAILLEKGPVRKQFPKPNENDLVGRFMNFAFGVDEDQDPRELRHPKLNKVVDAVNDAIEDVPHDKMKDFLWGLNYDFANGRVIESNLRKTIREILLAS